uniref:Class I SAM-dependent methyltransferase n=1 Tax=Aureoumbra lagunensis TaxID=44058 RepID=A0A7S3K2J2_9STRA
MSKSFGKRRRPWEGMAALSGFLVVVVIFVLYGEKRSLENVDNDRKWNEVKIVEFMRANPQRAYFSRLFRDGNFQVGVEVGVAGGRFAEHMISDGRIKDYRMIEPFPLKELEKRILNIQTNQPNGNFPLIKAKSLDKEALHAVEKEPKPDFIYLDGAHDYENVRLELEPYYQRLALGGVLAGHDYCDYGEKPLNCKGCDPVPPCVNYTTIQGRAKNQHGVVRAVQEWLLEQQPQLTLYHTMENFSPATFARDNMNYNLILTKTRNPSWFVVKPLSSP